jgi:hypothetical protein
MWVVAQLAEHRTVTATVEGSTPFDPPKIIADFRLPIADLLVLNQIRVAGGCSLVGTKRCTVDAEIASSSLVSPAKKPIGNRQSKIANVLRQ